MRVETCRGPADKGWCFGPWNSELPAAVGSATAGIDEPHLHAGRWEIYLVARGTALARVEKQEVALAAGDVRALAPGEAHTFLSSSPDYLHFVLHVPCDPGAPDKVRVPRKRLGLSGWFDPPLGASSSCRRTRWRNRLSARRRG